MHDTVNKLDVSSRFNSDTLASWHVTAVWKKTVIEDVVSGMSGRGDQCGGRHRTLKKHWAWGWRCRGIGNQVWVCWAGREESGIGLATRRRTNSIHIFDAQKCNNLKTIEDVSMFSYSWQLIIDSDRRRKVMRLRIWLKIRLIICMKKTPPDNKKARHCGYTKTQISGFKMCLEEIWRIIGKTM